jgi:hypothetical protein
MEEGSSEQKVSKYSSGLNIILRIDQLWKNCHSFKRNGKYQRWNEELDTIWLELARDLKEHEYEDGKDASGKDKEGYKKEYDSFDTKLKEVMPFNDEEPRGFKEVTEKEKNNRNEIYKILMEKQLFLARLENKLDKGTSWEDEDDDF